MSLCKIHRFFALSLACLCAASGAFAQDVSQMAFSDLQNRTNELVYAERLMDAKPYLEELVKRVESGEEEMPQDLADEEAEEEEAEGDGSGEDGKIDIDLPIYLLGLANIQEFVQSGQEESLRSALEWFNRLEEEYPQSSKLKEMLLKKVDILRMLNMREEVIPLMRDMVDGEYDITLTYSEEMKLLHDLTQVYYGQEDLEEGMDYFTRLYEETRDSEERALAAAAIFEALIEKEDLSGVMEFLPVFTEETDIRYRPRLNIAFLKASDMMVANDRVFDATLLLSLIQTRDRMVEHHESKIEKKESALERLKASRGSEDRINELERQIKVLESNLEQLKGMPSLRNELLVRRARNYTTTERNFEAFWMFHDLMEENPEHKDAEFYTYATFNNALDIDKTDAAIEVAGKYRSKFPDGRYYTDVTASLIGLYLERDQDEKFLEELYDFLDDRPNEPATGPLLAQWGNFMSKKEAYETMLERTDRWMDIHKEPAFEDGLYYWRAIAEMQLDEAEGAIESLDTLRENFPNSRYQEPALLRKGTVLLYEQRLEEARAILNQFLEEYPSSNALDQAYFYLGEVDKNEGLLQDALENYKEAERLTGSQTLYDMVAMRVGGIYETLEEYEKMASHFEEYIERFGKRGRLVEASHQLGRAYESLRQPNKMLALYRELIEGYAGDPDSMAIDTIVEDYAEAYGENKKTLDRTVEFIERLKEDAEFREKIVTDRGFLFEHFYESENLDQSLYNRMRNHPEFGKQLANDLSPINELFEPYIDEYEAFPEETAEAYFERMLAEFRAEESRIGEARMLMGLYRLDIEKAPSSPYDEDFLAICTPRLILYVADYTKGERRDFAIKAWEMLLEKYPEDDAAIVANMRLANVAADRGNKEEAIAYLETIFEEFPQSSKLPNVLLRQGELFTELGQTDKAREKYEYVLRNSDWRGKPHARALYQIGLSHMEDGAYDKAHGFFERTFISYLHLGEWGARAYLADAEALMEMGEKEDAINTLQEGMDEIGDSAPEDVRNAMRDKLRELRS
ncbi:MAG: tetratricopeptide repeat protein [Opitutales bacterium]